MPTIDIYPDCDCPEWVEEGAWCYCWGEGLDKFTILHIGENAAFLLDQAGFAHGWESFEKLHRRDIRIVS